MQKKYQTTPEWVASSRCTGKEKFYDPELAKEIAKQVSRRKEMKSCAYKCQTCGCWHVGGKQFKRDEVKKNEQDQRH